MTDTQGKERHFDLVKKHLFKIGFRLDVYQLISFKLGIMIDLTKLHILILL